MKCCLLFIFFVSISGYIDPEYSFIHGPGLKPNKIVLPCRYFKIHLFDSRNKSLEEPDLEDKLNISIHGVSNGQLREIKYNLLNNRDGTFFVRYKIYFSLEELHISVTVENKDLKGSPISIYDSIHSSTCECPHSSFEKWFKEDFECSEFDAQILSDFQNVSHIDIQDSLTVLRSKFPNPSSTSYCHYAIQNNKIYRSCFGDHVGFNMFMDNILLYLTRIVILPDTELLINLGDWPLLRKSSRNIGILSWCKTDEYADILLPTYDITEASLECMGRQMIDMLSVQGSQNRNWTQKHSKAFWRGRDSSRERLELVRLSLKQPELLNAGITRYFFFRDFESILGSVNNTSFFDFFEYKYQINVDGTVAAYRFPYLLASNSLVLKVDSEYYEHFYKNLQEEIHYKGVKKNLENLFHVIRMSIENNEASERIAKNARAFANTHLLPHNVFCYHASVLKLWTQKLRNKKIQINKSMTHVPNSSSPGCNCHRVFKDEL